MKFMTNETCSHHEIHHPEWSNLTVDFLSDFVHFFFSSFHSISLRLMHQIEVTSLQLAALTSTIHRHSIKCLILFRLRFYFSIGLQIVAHWLCIQVATNKLDLLTILFHSIFFLLLSPNPLFKFFGSKKKKRIVFHTKARNICNRTKKRAHEKHSTKCIAKLYIPFLRRED